MSSTNSNDNSDSHDDVRESHHRNNKPSDERVMNDSTMPPPKNPLSSQHKNDSMLMPPPSSKDSTGQQLQQQQKPMKQKSQQPRRKVGRFGLSDWNQLVKVSKDLAQLKGSSIRSNISWNEIKKHHTIHDGWIVIKNKVYNITPYIPYHPGGEKILLSTLGKDGTVLFEKYHRWVNEDGLIGKLLLGYLDKNSKHSDDDDSDEDDESAD